MLEARHPLAKFVAAFAAISVVTISESLATFAVTAAAVLAQLLMLGTLGFRRFARLMFPFIVFAATSSWIYLLAENPAYRAVGGSGWQAALIVSTRILTVGLISIAFAESTSAADLARALVQQWKVSRRFVYGALAAIQFMPATAEDYRIARLIARAAVDERPAPNRITRHFRLWIAGRTLDAFLVLFAGALRRAGHAAISMQMRGLGSANPTEDWRRWPFSLSDKCFLAFVSLFLAMAAAIKPLGQFAF